MSKEDNNKALEDAQRLENEDIPSDDEIVDQYRKDMSKAAQAAKLLKPFRNSVSRRKKSSKLAK